MGWIRAHIVGNKKHKTNQSGHQIARFVIQSGKHGIDTLDLKQPTFHVRNMLLQRQKLRTAYIGLNRHQTAVFYIFGIEKSATGSMQRRETESQQWFYCFR